MNNQEIVAHLRQLCPSYVIYEITMETVISAIVRRMGEEALELSAEDLTLAREEVKASRHVPLSLAALDIIQKLPRFEGCPYLLPNTVSLKPHANCTAPGTMLGLLPNCLTSVCTTSGTAWPAIWSIPEGLYMRLPRCSDTAS